jgi:hypothetical protein
MKIQSAEEFEEILSEVEWNGEMYVGKYTLEQRLKFIRDRDKMIEDEAYERGYNDGCIKQKHDDGFGRMDDL